MYKVEAVRGKCQKCGTIFKVSAKYFDFGLLEEDGSWSCPYVGCAARNTSKVERLMLDTEELL